jgi:hypothetical protein
MINTEYPLGHPRLEIQNTTVDWRKAADNPYKGIIKAFIIPPNNLKVPVLPKRLPSGRLAFILCNKCATENPNGLNATVMFAHTMTKKEDG